jgi:hypothetical protein
MVQYDVLEVKVRSRGSAYGPVSTELRVFDMRTFTHTQHHLRVSGCGSWVPRRSWPLDLSLEALENEVSEEANPLVRSDRGG